MNINWPTTYRLFPQMKPADRMSLPAPTGGASRSGGSATETTTAVTTVTRRVARRRRAIHWSSLPARRTTASRPSGDATGNRTVPMDPMRGYVWKIWPGGRKVPYYIGTSIDLLRSTSVISDLLMFVFFCNNIYTLKKYSVKFWFSRNTIYPAFYER